MDDGLRPRASPDDKVGEEGGGPRKKLRLTHDQSTLLEATFRQHSILTPTQKQELAAILELRPRQVEVWFQNRRARTKLKQTEVDCELLKRCCERLTDENRRLKKELQELRAAACLLAAPLSAHLPQDTATFTVCPSCQLRVAADDGRGNDAGAAKRPRRFHGSTIKDESDAF